MQRQTAAARVQARISEELARIVDTDDPTEPDIFVAELPDENSDSLVFSVRMGSAVERFVVDGKFVDACRHNGRTLVRGVVMNLVHTLRELRLRETPAPIADEETLARRLWEEDVRVQDFIALRGEGNPEHTPRVRELAWTRDEGMWRSVAEAMARSLWKVAA